MNRPNMYIGIKNILVAQVLAVLLLGLMTPTNTLVAKYDSGGVIGNLHMAVWSVSTVGWICAGMCMILGLAQLRNSSLWFHKAYYLMLAIIAGVVAGSVCFAVAVLIGPMQMREGLEEIEASYQTYWLFGLLLILAVVFLLTVVILGVVFNRFFLWGCAAISEEFGHPGNALVARVLFPVGIATLIGGIAAVCYYYYQSLSSAVDSRMMESARFDLGLMGSLWLMTQLLVIVVTFRTWRFTVGEKPARPLTDDTRMI